MLLQALALLFRLIFVSLQSFSSISVKQIYFLVQRAQQASSSAVRQPSPAVARVTEPAAEVPRSEPTPSTQSATTSTEPDPNADTNTTGTAASRSKKRSTRKSPQAAQAGADDDPAVPRRNTRSRS